MVHRVSIQSKEKNQMILITKQIQELVLGSKIQNGYVTLFVPHTTAAITINENADPDVKSDFMNGLSKYIPNDISFQHYEGNSDAHIKSSLVGVEQRIIIDNGKLLLGTWQGIYFCEFDGPRSRYLIVKISTD
jgi:secondary thiamine-phosphate synthase enzyme